MANNQTFTLTFDAKLNASQMRQSLNQIQTVLNGLHLPDSVGKGLDKTFTRLTEEVKNFEVAANKGINDKLSFNKLAKSSENILTLFEKLKLQLKDLGNLKGAELEKIFPTNIASNIVKANAATKTYTDTIKQLDGALTKAEKDVAKASDKLAAMQKIMQEAATKLPQAQASKESFANQLMSRLGIDDEKAIIGTVEKTIASLQEKLSKTSNAGWQTRYTNQIKDLQQLKEGYNNAATAVKNYEKALTGADVNKAEKDLKTFQETLTRLQTESKAGEATALDKLYEQLKNIEGIDLSNGEKSIENAIAAIQKYSQEAGINFTSALQKAGISVDELGIHFRETGDDIDKSRVDIEKYDAQVRDISALKSRIQYLFGITNAINLVKRAVREAFNTIKDLDKVMTATAVVTDFSVSDMWEQLPEYTKRANELGVTTQAAYEAATLYYQQGLKTNEVNALSVETLKMARIAGLDAAEATDRMTNALRGFNMELTEANAQRVDDVYSELAANTASNVDEISTAMTKVASLAHNANMEFETTAAFLAQIIETTRESAETAGTALKTVVARFSEVKKLVDEGQLKGTDEEGQLIDVNKVGAALRTAGIDLNKYFLGEVGLDDIFMELASKWDTLTNVQQRYIATQAAGSRQQSRFIALMQDYSRTQELVGKAYSANGASARQFAKTQESLESKLNRLKNAWNEFLMGLTNNVVIKTAVDLLTDLLNVINKLTSAFGEGASSVLKFLTAFLAFKGAKGLLSVNSPLLKGLSALTQGTIIGSIGQKAGIFGTGAANGAGGAVGTGGLGLGALLGKAGKGIWGGAKNLGTFMTGAGTIMGGGFGKWGVGASLTGSAGMAAGLTGIATAIGAIAVAIGAGVAAYQLWLHLTPEGRLKKATKEAEKLKETSEKAQKDLDSLKSLESNYQEKTEQVNIATTTEDRQKAILERNETILQAIKEDGSLAQYVVTEQIDDQIVLTLDEQKLADAASKAAETAAQAAIDAYFGTAKEANAQTDGYENRLQAMANSISTPEQIYMGSSAREAIEFILNSDYYNDKQKAKALELFNSIPESESTAKNNARLAYTEKLNLLGVNEEFSNQLVPILSDAFAKTNKEFSDSQLKSLVGQTNLISVLQAYNGQGNIKNISLGTDIENEEAFFEAIGITTDALEKLAEATGLDTNIIKSHIKANANQVQEIRKVNTAKIYQSLYEAGGKSYLTPLTEQKINGLSLEQLPEVASLLTNAQNLLSPDSFKQFASQALDLVGTDLFKELNNLLSSIDLNDAIGAFTTLTDLEKTASKDLLSYIENIKETNKELFTSDKLVQSFVATLDDDLSEAISKIVEEEGQLTAHNIEELSKESKTLATLLDKDDISAQGLANTLNALQQGNITIIDLNKNVLELFNSFDSVGNAIQRAGQFIKNFDPGEDWGDAYDFISGAVDKMQELLDNRELGNPQLRNYLKAFFTVPPESIASIQQAIDLLKSIQGNGGANFWTDILGFSMDSEGIIKDMHVQDFVESEFDSYKKYIKSLVPKDYNFTDDFYDLMMRNMGNHDYGVIKELAAAELEKIIGAYKEGLEGRQPTKAEVQAIANAYGLNPQDILDAYTGNAGELNFNDLENQIRETVTTISNLYSKYTDEFAKQNLTRNTSNLFKLLGADANGNFSLDQLKLKISQIVPEVADGTLSVEQWFNEQVQKEGGTIKVPVEYSVLKKTGDNQYGTEKIEATVEVSNLQEYEQAVEQLKTAANSEVLGQSLIQPLTDANSEAEALTNLIKELGSDNQINLVTAAITTATNEADNLNAALSKSITKNIDFNLLRHTIGISGGGSTVTLYISAQAKGGKIGSFAGGDNKPGLALTGEEAPEIIWNKEKGYAYLAGKDGPEINNLKPGDQVFNGEQTKEILKRSGISSFAKGTINSYDGTAWTREKPIGGNGSDDKDYKKESTWRNELDWLYDLMEDIAEEERKQTEIQSKYELATKDLAKTGKDLFNLTKQELTSLTTQLDAQNTVYLKRLQQMGELQTVVNSKGFQNYLQWNQKDQTLEIDWDKIEAIQDKDTYDELTDLISRMEEVQNQMDDAQKSILDIKKQINELQNRYLQQYLDFQKRVLDAVVKQYQDAIDSLSELNSALDETNKSILDSIQKEIDLERQIRDNTETEQNIADMEARLAYLQRDTSGANDEEIRQLQKQLEDARQSYSDSLVDQALNRLAESNDEASEQRNKQIELMQAQLDYWQEGGGLWGEVADLIAEGFTGDGSIIQGSNLWELLKDADAWDSMSEAQKKNWANELILSTNEVGAHLVQLSGGIQVNADLVRSSIAETNGILTSTISVELERVRAILAQMGTLGGTPEHSYTSEKTEGEGGYATGGLNTRPGKAMLHGTANEPEYVLNARQTDAFLRLAEVLPAAMSGNVNTSNINYGSSMFDININVDSISNDYDVDQLVERLKDDLADIAGYRNVNALSFIR